MKPSINTRLRRAEEALIGPNTVMVCRQRLTDLGVVLGHLCARLDNVAPPPVDEVTRDRLVAAVQDPPESLLGRAHAVGAAVVLGGVA